MRTLIRMLVVPMVMVMLPLAMICVAFEIARAIVIRSGPDSEEE